MDLEQVYFVSQIIAALAVVGSLIFVGLQMRLQANESRIATNSRLMEEYRKFALGGARDTKLSEAYRVSALGGFEAIAMEDRQRFAFNISSGLRILEQAFVLHEVGRLDARAWRSIELALSPMLLGKAGRQYWTVRRNAFYGPFQAYVDEFLNQPDLGTAFWDFLENPDTTIAAIDAGGEAEQDGDPAHGQHVQTPL